MDEAMDTAEASQFDIGSHIKTPQIAKLYNEQQKLKSMVRDLIAYQTANPKISTPKSRSEIDREKDVEKEIAVKTKYIRAQLAVIKALFRQGAMIVREEKSQTADARRVNDDLLLQLHNLQYEERSLKSEIDAKQGYNHKYASLPLISASDFIGLFPEHADTPEQELMKARIQHEYDVRVELEEQRQNKLKQKQLLFAEVKKGKDDLTKLDGMLETFIEAADPIKKVLEAE